MDSSIKVKDTVTDFRQWLSESFSRPGFADLHIDQFNPSWRNRDRWIEGGMQVLQQAVEACASASCARKLAMVYTLQSGIEPHGIDFGTLEAFQDQFDHSPPSLFIAELGSEPWITSQAYESVQTVPISQELVKRIFPVTFDCQGLLMQYRPKENEEASRSVWLLS